MKHSKVVVILFLLLMLLAVAACGASNEAMYDEGGASYSVEKEVAPMASANVEAMPEPDMAMPGSVSSVTTAQIQDTRKIIYNANMYLVVDDSEKAAQQIAEMAKSMGGYVASMNGYRQDDSIVYDITIRIPADKFDDGRSALRTMAVRVEHENISTDDVTDQYFDIEARLDTLKATEKELTELMKEVRQRGGKVEDIMDIYDRLIQIRSEIESLQGQLNRLDKLVAFSTIDIHLEPSVLSKPIESSGWRPAEIVRRSLDTLVDILAGLGTFLIGFVIIVVPLLIIILIPILLIIWAWKKWKKRKVAPQQIEEK